MFDYVYVVVVIECCNTRVGGTYFMLLSDH